jgi:tetratricopeptide (TPR) repeat protein
MVAVSIVMAVAGPGEAQTIEVRWERCQRFDQDRDNVDAAIADCTAVLQSGRLPTSSVAHAKMLRGYMLVLKKSFEEALQDLDDSLRLEPKKVDARLQRARAYLGLKRPWDAINDLETARDLSPTDYELANEVAELLFGHDARDRAIAAWQQLIASGHRDAVSHSYAHAMRERGERFFEARDFGRAIPDFSESIRIEEAGGPMDKFVADEIRFARAQSYARLGRDDEALADLDTCIRASPQWAGVYAERGMIYVKRGRFAEAVADLGRAIAKNPEDARALGARGQARLALGDFRGAVDDLVKSKAASRKDVSFSNPDLPKESFLDGLLGMSYRRIGDLERASVALLGSTALNPRAPWAHYELGLVHIAERRFRPAVNSLTTALALDANQPKALYARGLAKRALGDTAGADADIAAALRALPTVVAELAKDGIKY